MGYYAPSFGGLDRGWYFRTTDPRYAEARDRCLAWWNAECDAVVERHLRRRWRIQLHQAETPAMELKQGDWVEAPVDRAIALIELEELAELAIVQAPVDLDRPILGGDLHPCGDFLDRDLA